MTDYLTVIKENRYEFEVSRSKFICSLAHTENATEAAGYIAAIKKKYSGATHNCYAFIGTQESNEFRYSDDGEPSGTAGQPIYNALFKNGLYAVTAVVTRYFGGIKLGTGGLASAYKTAAAGCIKGAEIAESKLSAVIKSALSYGEYQTINSRLQASEAKVLDIQYGDTVDLTAAVPKAREEEVIKLFSEATLGSDRFKIVEHKHILYERLL